MAGFEEKLEAHRAGRADERLYLWCQFAMGMAGKDGRARRDG
jgi:hypothetical protein